MRMGCGRTARAVQGKGVDRDAKNAYLHRCMKRAESIDAGGNGNAPPIATDMIADADNRLW